MPRVQAMKLARALRAFDDVESAEAHPVAGNELVGTVTQGGTVREVVVQDWGVRVIFGYHRVTVELHDAYLGSLLSVGKPA